MQNELIEKVGCFLKQHRLNIFQYYLLLFHLNSFIFYEISKSVKDFKIEKTCYDDNIINEYIKSSAHLLIPSYFKSFNCILVPGTWLSGNIIPIFKNKGKSSDPKNYRLISILSCQGKLSINPLSKQYRRLLSKFMNTQTIFFFFKVISSNNECKEIIFSFVEYLCLKPPWLS
jgi:hypothetical protein